MKLFFCPKCHDVVKLVINNQRKCSCGESSGFYREDGIKAVLLGEAVPIGINNYSFANAIHNQPNEYLGKRFEAFIIPKKCNTVSYQ